MGYNRSIRLDRSMLVAGALAGIVSGGCGRTELYPRAPAMPDAGVADGRSAERGGGDRPDAADADAAASDAAAVADATDAGLAVEVAPIAVTQLVLGVGESCARLSNGSVKCWGGLYDLPGPDAPACVGAIPAVVPDLSDVLELGQLESHSCALLAGGVVRCWGYNASGQLGDGTTIDRHSPVTVAGLSGATHISVSEGQSCALMAGGTVRCWGAGYGVPPIEVPGLTGVLQLSTNFTRTCAVIAGGSVQCWSDGLAPVAVAGLAGVDQISVGFNHACVALEDGTARCWGVNDKGQLGDGTTTGTQQPVAVAGLSDVAAVAVGFEHSCARRRDGAVLCWGQDFARRLADESSSYSLSATAVSLPRPALELAAGYNHSCARLDDGSVWCWGFGYSGELGDGQTVRICAPLPVQGLSGASALVAGDQMSCALTSGEGLVCWGLVVQAPDWHTAPFDVALPETPETIEVAAGYDHACLLRVDGTVACWGSDRFGQLGDGNQGDSAGSAAPVVVAGLTGVQGITLGDGYACARLADGTAACWGLDQRGQLGDGTIGDGSILSRSFPAAVVGLSGVTALDSGEAHTCALLDDGAVSCWGANDSGQLGDGTTVSRSTPAVVPGLSDVVEISAGGQHTCARLADGTAACWGNDQRGQLGVVGPPNGFGISSPTVVPGLADVVQIVAGGEHTCARLRDGTASCWGANNNTGQLGDGTHTDRAAPAAVPGLSGVAALALGQNHSCALLLDGTARCWGDDSDGQGGVGWEFAHAVPVKVQQLP
jgi:alpha-tubulin suppressor-like RCC1 family protein